MQKSASGITEKLAKPKVTSGGFLEKFEN